MAFFENSFKKLKDFVKSRIFYVTVFMHNRIIFVKLILNLFIPQPRQRVNGYGFTQGG